MLELVPLPLPKHQRTQLALLLIPIIENYGAAAVAEQRIQQMSDPQLPLNPTSRIAKNTVLGFSQSQVRNMVRRELIDITSRSWASMRKE